MKFHLARIGSRGESPSLLIEHSSPREKAVAEDKNDDDSTARPKTIENSNFPPQLQLQEVCYEEKSDDDTYSGHESPSSEYSHPERAVGRDASNGYFSSGIPSSGVPDQVLGFENPQEASNEKSNKFLSSQRPQTPPDESPSQSVNPQTPQEASYEYYTDAVSTYSPETPPPFELPLCVLPLKIRKISQRAAVEKPTLQPILSRFSTDRPPPVLNSLGPSKVLAKGLDPIDALKPATGKFYQRLSSTSSAELLRILRNTSYSDLICNLENKLLETLPEGSRTREIFSIIDVLSEKHQALRLMHIPTNQKLRPPKRSNATAEFAVLLKGHEETINPWAATITSSLPNNGLLLQVTDHKARSQISDIEGGFTLDSLECDFYTFEGRKKHIQDYINRPNDNLAPFMATSASPKKLADSHLNFFLKRDLESQRPGEECTVMIHLIDGLTRLQNGWPVLRLTNQISRYDVRLPEMKSLSDYHYEFLLPLRVGAEQIVKSWRWVDVEAWMKGNGGDLNLWFAKVALPSFKVNRNLIGGFDFSVGGWI